MACISVECLRHVHILQWLNQSSASNNCCWLTWHRRGYSSCINSFYTISLHVFSIYCPSCVGLLPESRLDGAYIYTICSTHLRKIDYSGLTLGCYLRHPKHPQAQHPSQVPPGAVQSTVPGIQLRAREAYDDIAYHHMQYSTAPCSLVYHMFTYVLLIC